MKKEISFLVISFVYLVTLWQWGRNLGGHWRQSIHPECNLEYVTWALFALFSEVIAWWFSSSHMEDYCELSPLQLSCTPWKLPPSCSSPQPQRWRGRLSQMPQHHPAWHFVNIWHCPVTLLCEYLASHRVHCCVNTQLWLEITFQLGQLSNIQNCSQRPSHLDQTPAENSNQMSLSSRRKKHLQRLSIGHSLRLENCFLVSGFCQDLKTSKYSLFIF